MRSKQLLLLLAILVLLPAVLFSSLKSASFVDLDDALYVFNNPHVTSGLTAENVDWAFRPINGAGFWMPLTWISLQIDATIGGNKVTATPSPNRIPDAPPLLPDASIYHLHNIALHIVSTILLFFFLQAATRDRFAAFAVALLWSVHPLRVESVAWVTERKDVLAAAFGFLAMLLYVQWNRRPNAVLYAGVIVGFLLSLMAKPMLVTLPALLVLVDFWPLQKIGDGRSLVRAIVVKWPLWIMAIGGSVLTTYTIAHTGAIASLAQIPLSTRLGHVAVSYVNYLVAHVCVWNLSVGYNYPKHSAVEIITAIGVLLAITALCTCQTKRRPWLLFGWLWYVVGMLPVIGLVQAGEQGWADRFSHIPSVGLFVMLVFTAGEAVRKISSLRPVVVGGGVLLLAFFSYFTFRQVGYWHDSVTLFSRAVAVTPQNYLIHGNLAVAYLREGENERAAEQYEESARLFPNFPDSWLSLGALRLELGQYDKAVLSLQKAAQLKPRDANTRRLHGLALANAGFLEEAVHEFQVVLYLKPDDQVAARSLQIAQRKLAGKKAATQPAGAPLPK